MNRRELLCGVAAVGAAGGLAGCVADSGAPGDDPGGDATTERSPTLAGGELASVETDCADGEERGTASVAFDDERVTVAGAVSTSNPCYDAALDEHGYDAGADRLTVTVAVSPTDEFCATCTGVLRYQATVDFEGGLPGAVRVRHADGDATETVTTVSR